MSAVRPPGVNLAYRLDTLYAALDALRSDPTTEPAARKLVTLIRASSEFRNMDTLAQSAQQAEEANSEQFPTRLQALIAILQQEMIRMNLFATTVMIVSTDQPLVTQLQTALKARGYPVVITESPAGANQILSTQTVGVCIIDLVLTGKDGRDFIDDLRSKPATAALPIVAIEPQFTPEEAAHRLSVQDDHCFQKPVDPDDIVNFLDRHLKRGPAKGWDARRDPATGAPNRAACYEAFAQMQKACANDDPISIALIGIHRFNTLVRNGGRMVREDLIRQIAAILSSSFRSSDIVARWGVSEFAILMPGEDQYGATKAIEKVLPALNKQSITTPAGKKLPVILCAGLTVVNNQTPLEDAAATAECHLYMAFHQAWHSPGKYLLVSDAIRAARRSETIALYLSDPIMVRALQQVMERETFKVLSFSSPETLISALTRQPISLLAMDDNHPEEESLQLIHRIRALPDQKQLRTIMIVENVSGIEQSLKLGVHDYAIKPLSIPRLRSQLLRLLWQREEFPSHARMTIMVVDHEIPQLLIAGTALHQLGECRVLLAHGPQDALQRLMHTQPNYLVFDTTMPDMPGEEFIKAIPDLDCLKGMEIIPASPPDAAPIKPTSHKIPGTVSRPYRPITFVQQIRAILPLFHDETLTLPPFAPAPLEAEIQRVLSLRARHK